MGSAFFYINESYKRKNKTKNEICEQKKKKKKKRSARTKTQVIEG